MKNALIVAVLALALGLPAQVWAQEPLDYYLIELGGQIPSDLADRVAAAGGVLHRQHPEIGVAVAYSTDPGFASLLEADSEVEVVAQDYLVEFATEMPEPGSELHLTDYVLPDQLATGESGLAERWGSNPTPERDPLQAIFYPCQWNLHNIDADVAWGKGVFGSPHAKVAVLDTGIDHRHFDLKGRVDVENSVSVLSPGTSACNAQLGLPDEESFVDFRFHGTFTASQIVANGWGMTAPAPLGQVVSVKVLNCLGSGSFADLIAGIMYAADLPDVSVINMSLGVSGGLPKDDPDNQEVLKMLDKAVNHAIKRGKLPVSAAGNAGLDMTANSHLAFVPAQSGGGIGVYATAFDDTVPPYSNFGLKGALVGAPGGAPVDPNPPLPGCVTAPASQGQVVGACASDSVFFNCPRIDFDGDGDPEGVSFLLGQGTSRSAPIASAVAALADGQLHGWLNPHLLKVILALTADDLGPKGPDNLYSFGRVNAGKAVW